MNGFFNASTVQVKGPPSLVPRCGICGLYKGCQTPKMEVYGQGKLGVLVVGEAPGQTEDEEGRPFIGKAGQFLRQNLKQLGINLDQDCWTTNALICRPKDNKITDPKQISYCRPNLLNAIKTYQPRVIITLGRSALVSVLEGYWKDFKTMERWVGWKIPLEQHWVCPTYHPSYLLRMKNSLMDRIFSDHLEAAFEIEGTAPGQEDWASQIEILYDEKEVWARMREINLRKGWAAVDVETNCLKPEWAEAKIVSCAVSDGEQTISYPWTNETAKATQKFLESSWTLKIASNLKMEERWFLKNFGHGVTNWGWDTMLAAHCLDNRTGICSLKFQSFVKLGVPSYNEHIAPYLESSDGHYNRIGEVELKSLLLYGGIDALLEHRLAMLQRKEMGL